MDSTTSLPPVLLVGVPAIAAHMGLHPQQVRRLYRDGGLPALVWIARDELDAWIAHIPATKDYRPVGDHVGDFVAARIVRDAATKVPARVLYDA